MRRGARISEPAPYEFTDAVRWYEVQRPGLGAELFDAVVATIEGIERQPEIGAAAYPDPQTKRILVERFPYQVVYVVMRRVGLARSSDRGDREDTPARRSLEP